MLGTKKGNKTSCVVCDEVFPKWEKSYKKTNVFTNVPKKNYTPSDAFKLLGINVSPLWVK